MNFSYKINRVHIFFISLLALHYVISLIFIGQIAINIHDNLDVGVVYDHIISKIYKGNIESLSYLLAGEIKWYYFDNIFFPINILHYFLNDKLFYFTNGILKTLIAYFSFYLLAKSLNATKFNSAFGGALYSNLVFYKLPLSIGMAFLPYILYLLLNKDTLNKKHYFFLFLVGLNSSLVQDIFSFAFMMPLAFLINNKNKNFKVYVQVFLVILFSLILSGIHVVFGAFSEVAIHRESFVSDNSLIYAFQEALREIFYGIQFTNPLFIFELPIAFLMPILLLLSLFSKQKNIRLIIFFLIFIVILNTVLSTHFLYDLFLGTFEVFKGYNFLSRIDRVVSVVYTLLFILLATSLKNKKLKNFLFFITFFSILSIQLKTPLPVIGEHFLKKNMFSEKFEKTKKSIFEKDYIRAFKIIFNAKNYTNNKINSDYYTNKTFDNYYKFNDYAFIKNIVTDSRVMSVGLDPMIAVMNDMRVIDGYHGIYPLSYKIQFRKIIEKELESNIILKKYYDDWGSRVYAFYNDQHNIMLNFKYAKKLGADYVISKFPIKNSNLKIICYECNNSSQMFLYRIL